MYVCVHICMCVHIYVCTLNTYIYSHVCVNICMCSYVKHACPYVHTCIHSYACIHTYMHRSLCQAWETEHKQLHTVKDALLSRARQLETAERENVLCMCVCMNVCMHVCMCKTACVKMCHACMYVFCMCVHDNLETAECENV
jgi:hypothetical protein